MNRRRNDLAVARRRMVEEQLKGRGIHDLHVLRIMEAIPRHLFVEETLATNAYSDHALPIGEEQTISQPYMVALMTQALGLTGEEKVLEIGTGSGYQTAVLAELAGTICTVERIPSVAATAKERLDTMGYRSIVFRCADGSLGWKEMGPYDRVLVTAGAPRVPAFFEEQLKINGIGVVPVGDSENQSLVKVTRTSEGLVERVLCNCTFVPLIGREGWSPGEVG
jgi:protein-L-isoaspartate(D-aspartate) O-methyltransferase